MNKISKFKEQTKEIENQIKEKNKAIHNLRVEILNLKYKRNKIRIKIRNHTRIEIDHTKYPNLFKYSKIREEDN